MAGGKLTPRQKMINLMYLVFIAMLALNMSKEVLSAFGLMNEKFETTNKASKSNNEKLLSLIDQKGTDNSGLYGPAKNAADKIAVISKNLYEYIETLKADATNGIELDKKTGKLPYEAMDKGPHIDETWFKADGYSAKGNEIIAKINQYVADMKAAAVSQDGLAKNEDEKVSKKLATIVENLAATFNTADVKDGEGVTKKYLSYHFEHFPAIASLAKLSAWQNDIKKAEFDCYSSLLGGAALDAASMSNYTALVVLEKSAYYQGEAVKGKVVLGRYDENTKPTSFQGPGKIENGQAVISMTAGSIGEQNINGQFTFMEKGKSIPLKFEGKYVVIPRPNSATVSSDNMKVIYKGVDNPMSITFAGVADNNVTASGPGLKKAAKGYIWNVGNFAGKEATVSVTAKLSDGKSVSDTQKFRVKDIPYAFGMINGRSGTSIGSKGEISSATIGVDFGDFGKEYKVTGTVTGFDAIIGKQKKHCAGNTLSSEAINLIKALGKNDVLLIDNITSTTSTGVRVKTFSCAFTIN
jgi:gliding motility-associated protein GldM